jgi:hypothetical protein
MVSSDEDRGRSRRPGAEDWGWSNELSDAMCGLHRAQGDEEHEFLD